MTTRKSAAASSQTATGPVVPSHLLNTPERLRVLIPADPESGRPEAWVAVCGPIFGPLDIRVVLPLCDLYTDFSKHASGADADGWLLVPHRFRVKLAELLSGELRDPSVSASFEAPFDGPAKPADLPAWWVHSLAAIREAWAIPAFAGRVLEDVANAEAVRVRGLLDSAQVTAAQAQRRVEQVADQLRVALLWAQVADPSLAPEQRQVAQRLVAGGFAGQIDDLMLVLDSLAARPGTA